MKMDGLKPEEAQKGGWSLKSLGRAKKNDGPGYSYLWGLSIFFQEYIYGLSPLSPELSFRRSLLVGVADTLDITDRGTSDRDIV